MKTSKLKIAFLMLAAVLLSSAVYSQKNTDPVKIDKNGRMIWKNNNKEAFFWGVNYTTPFAHAYRQIAKLGEEREKVIDIDTYHLSRLGTNAYRIHVWDCEISDSIGNLLQNEHLKLLDYLIYRFQQRGVYIFLTPIAYWGNGYPEPEEKLPGFSGKYNKGNVYILPEAIAAQERYLKQFVNHVNPYTGKAYKNDPMIVGFEVCNEPGHSKAAETTEFVKKMIAAIKSTGCAKPVFYNVTQSINLLPDFIKGGTDGVTFQWYPTGLVAGHEQQGNFLPQIDEYFMPFKNEKYFANQARLVYEFDAADIGRSYMYPPIALSFKEAGMQWVTMFAYDPIALAASNTEYQTHFLNLAYAPQKAIGFKIAGELFRNPQYKRDRENEKKPFDMKGLKISYTDDISELATNELFFHTSNTSTNPPNLSTLKSIAGYGTSPVVSYKGYGAYFLDKISDRVWRLEVMPDAIWVRDPFSRATPKIENVVIKWNKTGMGVNLPDLGKDFTVTGINDGNNFTSTATEGRFTITPGAYILSTKPVTEEIKKTKIGVITANEFFAPRETNKNFYFLQNAPEQVSEGQPVVITVKVVSPAAPIKKLTLQPSGGGQRGFGRFRPVMINMDKVDEYKYKATIPDSIVKSGLLTYTIIAESTTGKTTIYPGGVEGPTSSWEYFNPDSYSVRVLPAASEVQLFNAESSGQALTFSGNPKLRGSLVLSGVTGESMLRFAPGRSDFGQGRPNTSGVNYAIQNYIGNITQGISRYADKYTQILIHGKASDKPVKIEVTMINKDGNAYSIKTSLFADQDVQTIKLKDLTEGKMFLLPRPYPGFLPFWYSAKTKKPFSISEIERIQLLVPVEGNEELPMFELTSITLK
ncbi:MAG: cellulase family glycosylhydrolase [Bacteroidia bacterium]|nr:cellulase family glycosylhydrolase [Bacteroidia bacterium]